MLENTSVDASQQSSPMVLPSCSVDLSRLSVENQKKLVAWNTTATDYPSILCIHALVEAQVERTPEQIALIFESQELTYQGLNQRANQLAHRLKALGVGPEMLVGICLERSVEMIVALLAILKAGAGYLPLDMSYPLDRLRFMVENAQVPVLLTQSSLMDQLPTEGRRVICLNQPDGKQYPETNLHGYSTLDNLGYVIYTSGSTGKPKGVAMGQRALVNLLHWQCQQSADLAPGARTLQFTPMSFDVSFQEIFSTLVVGGTLVLIRDDQRRNPMALLQYLESAKIQRLFLPFVALRQLAEISEREALVPTHLRHVITAGEQLRITPELVHWFHAMAQCRLHNHYGPSESHVVTAFTLGVAPEEWPVLPPIGRPIANTQIYLLDAGLKAVPVGETGELYIAGDCLARGYLHRPEITAERFIAHGIGSQKTMLYKTGDLARFLPDGAIEYLGRSDQQIKIRGFRIEPGEIETVLEQQPEVEKAVVLAREATPGQFRLAAYVVAKEGYDGLDRRLSEFAAAHLPDYMVPSAYGVMAAFPLTPSGKVDRRRLPVLEWMRSQTAPYVSPRNPLEKAISQLWTQLLGIQDISIHDRFCSLGGHSLMAVQVIYQIKEQFGVELDIARFLENATVAVLAEWVDQIQTQGQIEAQENAIAAKAYLDETIQLPVLPEDPVPNYFLTGATGFLGAYLLHDLLRNTRGDVYCLVRSTSVARGMTRLKNSLKRYRLWTEQDAARIIPVTGSLSLPQLGMRSPIFDRLANKIDVIYHCGSWVNVLYPYSALEAPNVIGTQEVLRLASQSRVKPVHYISTVDVFAVADGLKLRTVGEAGDRATPGPVRSLFSGYAKSKYIAETLIQEAHGRGLPVIIYRPSNIMGDTNHGICPPASFITKMIQGCLQVGVAPDINAALNLVPVDYVSRAIVQLSQTQIPSGQAFNIVNPQVYGWNRLVDWMVNQGYGLRRVDYETWCSDVINVVRYDKEHPLFFLTTVFSNVPFIQKLLGAFNFDCDRLQAVLPASMGCADLEQGLLSLYFQSMVDQGLVPPVMVKEAVPELAEAVARR